MNRKKLTLFLAALLLAPVVSLWGGAGSEAAAEESKEVSMLSFFEFSPDATSETYVFKLWGENTDAVINPIHVTPDDYNTRVQTLIASGSDLPDIMQLRGSSLADLHFEYGPAGLFLNTTQAVKDGKMPNLKALVAQFPDLMLYADDGNSYMQPHVGMDAKAPLAKIQVRADYLAKAGWDLGSLDNRIKTLDDWLEALRVVYKAHNEGKAEPEPIMINRRQIERGWVVRPIMYNLGTDIRIVYNESGRYEFGPLHPNFKVGLQFLNTLYKEGILHPAWVTMREEEQKAMWAEGKYAMLNGPSASSLENWAAVGSSGMTPEMGVIEYTFLPPEVGGKRAKLRAPARLSGNWVINAKSKALSAAIRVTDFAYGDRGAELLCFGEEGYAWKKAPDTPWGRIWIKNWSGAYPAEGVEADKERKLTRGVGLYAPGIQRLQPSDMWGKDILMIYYDPYLPNAEKRFKTQEMVDNLKSAGLWINEPELQFPFTTDELEERNQLMGSLHTYVDEELVKFINDKRSFDTYNDFVAQLNKLGAKRLEELYNTALDRYKKAIGQ